MRSTIYSKEPEHDLHAYEVRPTRDGGGAELISEQLPFGRLRYGGRDAVENAIGYARFFSKAHPTEIKVYDAVGALVITHKVDARTATDLII